MEDWVLITVLGILVVLILVFHKEDQRVTDLKTIYYKFIQRVPEKYKVLRKPVCVTGIYNGDVGTNVNKGSEIFVCIDGTTNDSFHVLLHELAHSTVTEYDHSHQFWENFEELKKIAKSEGMYSDISKKSYCGKTISDS
jgi:hypothetical protein